MARILAIDGDPEIVDLLRFRLAEWGHQVFSAMDATAGMMLAAREKPDLVTLDFQIPAGDGATVYARLRGNTFTAKTKIIFISGMNAYHLERSIPDDPGVRFLPKPIDMEALKLLIVELLEGRAPTAAAPSSAASPAAEAKPVALDGGAFGGDILDLKLPP